MPETEDSQQNISYIRTHVDNIERMQWFQLASSPHSAAFVKQQFEAKKHSARVYLALEKGPKTQEQLIKTSKMSQPNISRILTHLEGLHFIDSIRAKGRFHFKWTEAEKILNLSKIAKTLSK